MYIIIKCKHYFLFLSLTGSEHLSVLIAAGPFSTSDNLSYEPLNDLSKYMSRDKPNVCILVRGEIKLLDLFFLYIDYGCLTPLLSILRELYCISEYLHILPKKHEFYSHYRLGIMFEYSFYLYHIYTPTKVKHHPIFLSIYFFTSIL